MSSIVCHFEFIWEEWTSKEQTSEMLGFWFIGKTFIEESVNLYLFFNESYLTYSKDAKVSHAWNSLSRKNVLEYWRMCNGKFEPKDVRWKKEIWKKLFEILSKFKLLMRLFWQQGPFFTRKNSFSSKKFHETDDGSWAAQKINISPTWVSCQK